MNKRKVNVLLRVYKHCIISSQELKIFAFPKFPKIDSNIPIILNMKWNSKLSFHLKVAKSSSQPTEKT